MLMSLLLTEEPYRLDKNMINEADKITNECEHLAEISRNFDAKKSAPNRQDVK